MEQLIAASAGAAGMGILCLVCMGLKKGIPALVAKLKGWFASGKAELEHIESVLSADIQALVARVEALEGKLAGVAAIAPAKPPAS